MGHKQENGPLTTEIAILNVSILNFLFYFLKRGKWHIPRFVCPCQHCYVFYLGGNIDWYLFTGPWL